MSITVAGRQVLLDDPLYHTGFKAWGVVIGFDGGSAKLEINGANGQQRVLYVQQGGLVNGVRVIYWHEPLRLDLPFQNITKYQRLMDNIVAEFPS
jgi:hypothetical protein